MTFVLFCGNKNMQTIFHSYTHPRCTCVNKIICQLILLLLVYFLDQRIISHQHHKSTRDQASGSTCTRTKPVQVGTFGEPFDVICSLQYRTTIYNCKLSVYTHLLRFLLVIKQIISIPLAATTLQLHFYGFLGKSTKDTPPPIFHCQIYYKGFATSVLGYKGKNGQMHGMVFIHYKDFRFFLTGKNYVHFQSLVIIRYSASRIIMFGSFEV